MILLCGLIFLSGRFQNDKSNFMGPQIDPKLLDRSDRILKEVNEVRRIPSLAYLGLLSKEPSKTRESDVLSWCLVDLMPCPVKDCNAASVVRSLNDLRSCNDEDIKKIMAWLEWDYENNLFRSAKGTKKFQRVARGVEICRKAEMACEYIYKLPYSPFKNSVEGVSLDPAALDVPVSHGKVVDPLYIYKVGLAAGRRQ